MFFFLFVFSLHADFTELTGCVDQELDKNEGESARRRYFYITLLRSPIPRYLSEFRHVKRGLHLNILKIIKNV